MAAGNWAMSRDRMMAPATPKGTSRPCWRSGWATCQNWRKARNVFASPASRWTRDWIGMSLLAVSDIAAPGEMEQRSDGLRKGWEVPLALRWQAAASHWTEEGDTADVATRMKWTRDWGRGADYHCPALRESTAETASPAVSEDGPGQSPWTGAERIGGMAEARTLWRAGRSKNAEGITLSGSREA